MAAGPAWLPAGAATADALYGALPLSVTAVSHDPPAILVAFPASLSLLPGVRTFLSRPGRCPSAASWIWQDYISTFFLTLTNPLTILSFAAVFAGLGLGTTGGTYFEAGMLVAGVFLGSALWWWILSFGIGAFRDRFNPRGLRWINRISGLIILGFGVAALVSSWGSFDSVQLKL
jgi:threonine/homoserine/homoserine lactone efflux protein